MNNQNSAVVASTINFANIIKSDESNTNLLNLILLFRNNWCINKEKNISSLEEYFKPVTIEIHTDGEVLIDNKPLDLENPPEGVQIFVDRKSVDGK